MQKRMIHNDITRSAERAETHSLSLFICVFVCFSKRKEADKKKKGKNGSKLIPRGEN